MRSSSRRSKVTRFAGAKGDAPLFSPPADWLGSLSPGPKLIGASIGGLSMIVPDRDDGKRRSGWGGYKPVPVPRRRLRQNGRPFTASLAQVIMLPDFSQGGSSCNAKRKTVASRARFATSAGFLSPQPSRV